MAWADKSIHGYKSNVQLSLVDLFHQFEDNVKRLKQEIADEDLWASIGPNGNIYRLNALDQERLKHQWDLQCQLSDLAEHFAPLLDAHSPSPSNDNDTTDVHENRRRCLIKHLMTAAVMHDVEEGSTSSSESSGEGPSQPSTARRLSGESRAMFRATLAEKKGFAPLAEFLCPAPPICFCCFLLPGDLQERRRYIKNLFVGFLVCALQIIGPLFVVIDDWGKEDNPLVFQDSFSSKELKCLGTKHHIAITFMGTLFLLVIFEVVRAYAKIELSNFDKCKYLPAGNHWMRLGHFANMICISTTVLAMPLVFWTELEAKEIIFDALAMMFVLSLDDLTHETFAYMEMEDNDFRRICTWSIALLGQCPLKLVDVVNMDAESADEIWSIRLTKEGLVCPRTGDRCVTRLMEAPASERTSLLKHERHESTFKCQDFLYAWREGESQVLRSGYMSSIERFLWSALCYILIVLEVIIPSVFFVINKPCYTADNHPPTLTLVRADQHPFT